MNPAATLARLLGALEDLGRREEIALATGDAHEFLELEQRAEPLARRLAALVTAGVQIAPDLLRRGHALISARVERRARLFSEMEQVRDDLGRLDAARARARSLRAHHAPASFPAFSAIG